jgi:hypothetical protein
VSIHSHRRRLGRWRFVLVLLPDAKEDEQATHTDHRDK